MNCSRICTSVALVALSVSPVLAGDPPEFPSEWMGEWEVSTTIRDCETSEIISSETNTEIICPGDVFDSPEKDDECVGEIDANGYEVDCSSSDVIFEDCTINTMLSFDVSFSGASYSGTGVFMTSFVGEGCGDIPDLCQNFEISGSRVSTDVDCSQTPTLPHSWGRIKSAYR